MMDDEHGLNRYEPPVSYGPGDYITVAVLGILILLSFYFLY